MKILRAYKTELDPNNRQRTMFQRCAGIARFVFNWGLAEWQHQYEDGQKVSAYKLKKQFNAIKGEQCPFVTQVPYAITEAAFANLGSAFQHFFRRVKNGEKPGYPRFKSRRHPRQSFQLRNTRIELDRVRLTGVGWVRLKERGYLPTTESGTKFGTYATVSRRAGRWYISVQVEEEVSESMPLRLQAIGIDLGLKSRAVLSDGTAFNVPKALYDYERQIKCLSRELARRKRGGANWQKTKDKLARAHAKVARTREHWQHQITHHVTEVLKPQAIVLEDLNVSGMQKNRHLSKAVADASFYELRRQLEYKAEWAGIEVIIADRWFPSSKMCSSCGWRNEDLSLADRVFWCPECGLEIDRDLNAAKNLASLAV